MDQRLPGLKNVPAILVTKPTKEVSLLEHLLLDGEIFRKHVLFPLLEIFVW